MRSDVANLPRLCPAEIHQAEGILAERLKITVDEAAQVLRNRAATDGISLLDAALGVRSDLEDASRLSRLDPWGSC